MNTNIHFRLCKGMQHYWDPNNLSLNDNNIYLVKDENVIILSQKVFDINNYSTSKSRLEILFYVDSFGFDNIRNLELNQIDNQSMLCKFCQTYYSTTFKFSFGKEDFYICPDCKTKKHDNKNGIFINNKYNGTQKQLELFVKKNKEIRGFYHNSIFEVLLNIFYIINVPWFSISNGYYCMLCHNYPKYFRNFVCIQCYNYALDLVYQQYHKVLLIKNSIQGDIYFNIHWIMLYLINYDLGANYNLPKPITKEIIKDKIRKEEIVIVEGVDDDYTTYIAGNIEEPDYSDLGYFDDSEGY